MRRTHQTCGVTEKTSNPIADTVARPALRTMFKFGLTVTAGARRRCGTRLGTSFAAEGEGGPPSGANRPTPVVSRSMRPGSTITPMQPRSSSTSSLPSDLGRCGSSGLRRPSDLSARLGISQRDRSIVALALRNLGGAAFDFGEAVRALREAVEELIPAGRTYLLGHDEHGPIVGSIVSGVGIVAGAGPILLVRVHPNGRLATLARFTP